MLNEIDVLLFNAINKFAGMSPILDNLMIFLAKYAVFFLILVPIFLWFKGKEYKNLVLYSVYSAVLGRFFNYLITLFYFHPRPFMENLGALLINHAYDSSFPSDHTTLILSIGFMFLYFRKTRKIGSIISVFGLLVGAARVFVGVHFPLDIVGSFFVSLFSSSIIYLLKEKLQIINEEIIRLYHRVTCSHC